MVVEVLVNMSLWPDKSLQPTRLSAAPFGGRGGALDLSRSRRLFLCCSPRVVELAVRRKAFECNP